MPVDESPERGLPTSYARGVRTPYAALPGPVRGWVEQVLGGPVLTVDDRIGGFSPGTAAVVSNRDRSAFVKAVSGEPNPTSLRLYRAERHQLAALPPHPAIPAALASTDLTVDGVDWVATVFPALPGRPPRHPWTPSEAGIVFDRLADLQTALAGRDGSGLPDSTGLVDFFSRWSAIVADPDDPWSRRPPADVERRLAAEERVQRDCVGDLISHVDLRADNVIIDGDRVWFVDWVEARRAADWVDPAILAADLVISGADRADGGELDVVDFVSARPGIGGLPRFLDLVTTLAGSMHWLSRRPAPPGLPTIRGWQDLTAERLIRFADRKLGPRQI